MNERIQELAEHAKQFARDQMAHSKKPYLFSTSVFEEKFAELIIQKCISQIALIGVSNFGNEDIMWTVETAIASIDTHFGIKE